MLSYVEFLKERMNIWLRKEVLLKPMPYTDDKVLQMAKFCNIYRELDKATIFEIHELNRLAASPIAQLEFILKFRLHNKPSTCLALRSRNARELIAGDMTGTLVSDALIGWEQNFGKTSQLEWLSRLLLTIEYAVGDGLYYSITNAESPDEVLELLALLWKGEKEPYPEFINFWCYEIYTSLTYCSWFPWDEDSYYVIGPGCKPALKRLTGSDDRTAFEVAYNSYKSYLGVLNDFVWIPEQLQPRNPVPKKFTKRVFEHSLCEWRKYFQICEGREPRRLYKPGE